MTDTRRTSCSAITRRNSTTLRAFQALARKLDSSGKPLLTLDSPGNPNLMEMEANISPQGFTTQRRKEAGPPSRVKHKRGRFNVR